MTVPIENHPCFNDESRHKYGRIHLPVAPKCNIQCNFCNRKFDCLNENRPGVTSKVLSPYQALHYLKNAMEIAPNIAVVGIAGPGDPFANPEETMQTLGLVREAYPEILLCVATNGLNVLPYINELAELKVSHVTLTINAIDPEIGAEIYSWVRYRKKMYRGIKGAEILLENQMAAIKKLKEVGITAKINSIIIPGVNDHHTLAVAEKVSEMGANILNCLPYYQNEGTVFENVPSPEPALVKSIQDKAGEYLPQMKHCARCRADAIGIIGETNSEQVILKLHEAATMPLKPVEERPYVAVTSLEGVLINQHLGEADYIMVYEYDKETGTSNLVESRRAPAPGGGTHRWELLAKTLSDCRAVMVSGAGNSPTQVLKKQGIEVMVLEGVIDEAVTGYFTGKDLKHLIKSSQIHACGTSCKGAGTGCG